MENMAGSVTITMTLKWQQITKFRKDFNYAIIEREDGYKNIIDSDGNILFEEWFSEISFCPQRYIKVRRRDGKYNILDMYKKRVLSENWFYWADNWYLDSVAVQIEKDGEIWLLNCEGKLKSFQTSKK